MSIKENRLKAPNLDGKNVLRSARYTYDFAVHGGVVGTITLGEDPLNADGNTPIASAVQINGLPDHTLPSGAIVLGAYLDVTTLFTGGATSLAFQVESAGDLKGTTSITGFVDSTGVKALIPVMTAGTAIKTTASRAPKMVISGANLTAGKAVLHLLYVVS